MGIDGTVARMEQAAMRRRVASARVGELATTRADGRPHVVVVCFALEPDRITTVVDQKPKTTTALRRLENIRANPAVSLLVHHYEEDWSQLWWVRVDGRAEVVDARDEVAALLPPLVEKYPQYRSRTPVGPAIVIRPSRWIGWMAAESRS
jgi:PPOX class probable F420-dependent enzyme